MLCVVRVAVSGVGGLDEVVDVDPTAERMQGLLRAGYLCPLVRRAMAAAEKPAESVIEFKVEAPVKPRARGK